MNAPIAPYHLAVPQADLDDLHDRLSRTRWPDELPDSGWAYGVPLATIQALAEQWGSAFDWRAWEARLNHVPQFTTVIDGQPIHFLHIVSPEPSATPLLLTHGWPGSVLEFLEVLGPLSDPAAHGGDAEDAFHLVIPSIPGFGPAGPTLERGWDVPRIADAWLELMARLGYERFGAQGGDWGMGISRQLAATAPDRLLGVHLNYLVTPRRPPVPELSPDDAARLAEIDQYLADPPGHMRLQATRPQTLAFSLMDSPVGQLAWIAEKALTWTDPATPLSADWLLANVSLYWLTRTAASSARLYRESAGKRGPVSTGDVPVGVAVFPHDLVRPVRALAEPYHHITQWTEMPRGGHFAALEAPELLVADIRAFFRPLRATAAAPALVVAAS
ncbi:MAG: epoxide hydrolase [Thermomicrobiales bacterium]